MTAHRVEVFESDDELATAVAGELLSRLADAQDSGREPQIALTGGTIAEKIHREIARLSPDSEVDWSRVVVWWGDERFVEASSPDRNALQARTAFLDQVGVDPAKVHEMGSSDDFVDPAAAAASYGSEMREHGSGDFDVVMLGLGPDGHVASLFPGHDTLDVDDAIAVGETDSPKPPPLRVSLTFAALNHSRATWLVVSGEGKAEAVARVLATDGDVHETPGRGVRGHDETVVWVDRAAASRI